MRVRLTAGALLLALAAVHDVAAAIRFTDVSGREVVLKRGAPVAMVKAASRLPQRAAATITVNAGPDIDAANNDYRRIQNALNAAVNGDTIILNGTFDFTQPFAAASWALGNDNTAATADDYEVLVPSGLSNVTLTAASLGSATIQGPGDLATVNLEAFLVFDGGPNPGWTISNLTVFDFDLSIGMFASGATDFNSTHVQNNLIRIPNDLNAIVAPVDVNQNIGLHFSFGKNQIISGNTFQIPGDGISAGANTSSAVAMQSNTSGGSIYDGLNISNNVIHVLNAQSANPQATLGIWENAHGHTSNITVANNSFINDAAGNSPALNGEKAFRVTSHSSATTTVLYSGNQMSGANVGFQWIAGSNFSGNQAVVLDSNVVTNCDTGILIQSNGIAHIQQNNITVSGAGGGIHIITGQLGPSAGNPAGAYQNFVTGGSGDGIWFEAGATVLPTLAITQNDLRNNALFDLRNDAAPTALAETNWWGQNFVALAAAKTSGNADFDPILASGTDVAPATPGFQPFIFATTSGTLTTFSGTAGADTGAALAGDPVTWQMNGQTATTALGQLVTLSIQLGASDDVFTLGQIGVPTTFDGGSGNDTLVGSNVAQTWNITGSGSGDMPGAASSFTGVESLRGGTAADSFVFGADGSVAQTVDGGLGVDSLDNSAIPGHTVTPVGPGTLDGFRGTATGIGVGFDNINAIAGSPADIAVTKTAPATATAGTVISYSITVTNNGPNAAINATLTDVLPPGTTFAGLTVPVAPAGWSCTTPALNAAGTVTCSNLSLPLGSSGFTLLVNGPAAPGSVSNTATVAEASSDPVPGNNSSTATTNVVFTADVSVTKTATATAAAGTTVNYTLVVANAGPSAATSVVLTDALPANTTFLAQSQSTGPTFGCTTPAVGAGGTVTCTIASLASGATATLSIDVTVRPSAPAGPSSNTATVSTTATDPVPGNNSATAVTTISTSADVSVSNTATAAAPPGSNITYTIVVTNNGPSNASSVSLTDTLPPDTTFVSQSQPTGPTFTCTTPAAGTGGTVTCNIASFASSATATFTIVVNVSPSAPAGPLPDTANVAATTPDPAPANNASTASTTVGAASSDLSITKTAAAGPYVTSAPLTYTLTVQNAGPTAAGGVVITDVLPAGTSFVSATPSQGSCTGTTTVTCSAGTIAAGATATVTLVVTLPATSGTVTNTASLTSTTPDPNAANNSSTATISTVQAIPTATNGVLLLLAIALAFAGMFLMRE